MKRRAAGEFAAVLTTVGLFLLFENVLGAKMPFLILCILLWGGYVLRRAFREPGVLKAWGIRRDNLAPAALRCLPVFFAMALLVTGYRLVAGWRLLPPTSVWIFCLYPFWAFLQQFQLQALVAANLEEMGLRRWAVAAVASPLFGLAHAPDWALAYYWILERDPWRELFHGPG